MGDKATVVALDARFCIATWQGILIQLWRTGTPKDGVERAIDAIVQSKRPIVATIVVIEKRAALPDPDGRRALDVLMKRLHPNCRCAGMVYEGSGFGAAAVRAIVTSLLLVVKQPFQQKVVSSVEQGAAWMKQRFPDVEGIDALPAVVKALRAEIDAAPAHA